MPSLTNNVLAFCELLERGEPLRAMERFYADDVCVFDNRELARAGREQCLAHEREALTRLPAPPSFKVHRYAVNDATQVVFIEYTLRFLSEAGRPMRIEQVSVQTWEGARISTERFYYEGVVDEGDEPPRSAE
ncbi:MAG TPA: hypothetical protein VFQ35_23385 [Polyangiaceae bacterium]|nr:hypothetical protein [Polyangiaceae bacterium]